MKFLSKAWLKFAVIALFAGAAYGYFAWQESKVKYLSYQVTNSLKYVSLDEVDAALIPHLSQSFWDVDMQAVKQDLEQVNWIKQASVRRNWPGYLDLEIEEHQPVARWGQKSLISATGVVFQPADLTDFAQLVQLQGDELQAKNLLKILRKLQKDLAKLDWQLLEISQQVDGIIRIQLANQQQIIVNANDLEKKLARFITAYPKLPEKLVESAQNFDLRYSNGLAIKVTDKQ